MGGRGKIYSKSLERSTVDLAMEFVNLIQNQRGFQANAKTITTTDELLGEVIQLKR
jgi:flagellar hook protein FlgE